MNINSELIYQNGADLIEKRLVEYQQIVNPLKKIAESAFFRLDILLKTSSSLTSMKKIRNEVFNEREKLKGIINTIPKVHKRALFILIGKADPEKLDIDIAICTTLITTGAIFRVYGVESKDLNNIPANLAEARKLGITIDLNIAPKKIDNIDWGQGQDFDESEIDDDIGGDDELTEEQLQEQRESEAKDAEHGIPGSTPFLSTLGAIEPWLAGTDESWSSNVDSLRIVKSLLQHGANASDGLRFLSQYSTMNLKPIIDLLFAHGADLNAIDRENGKTTMHVLADVISVMYRQQFKNPNRWNLFLGEKGTRRKFDPFIEDKKGNNVRDYLLKSIEEINKQGPHFDKSVHLNPLHEIRDEIEASAKVRFNAMDALLRHSIADHNVVKIISDYDHGL